MVLVNGIPLYSAYVKITYYKKIYSEVVYPHSLGLLYSTITAFLGFKPNEGEYKVMGLAPYGTHLFHHKKFDKLIKETEDGFELNMDYFSLSLL